ncbi:MAG: isoprenylcysteine carboxylmethyltransferase family protein [Ignavibacterium album]|jgi:protein-S-isoprenylcysteine O-methyltransferase Ste14|uniref:methyltransferase family protein n=1 Tax=Ignavibacterium album TaxID=591197 RepID=UPI0026EE5D7B|nr:isoprenylcysteine carboxylmethyltransferase family protein [Ignavibacterium album]MCX8105986.1 isoprenylcysteine carboxylmethyltransferase family protein [Ignavibacterium album]
MKKLAELFFRYRSYTPIPFLILMIIFENATTTSLIAGFIIALIGESIRLWGVSWAGSETRTTGKVGGTYLIISGPFAYVRNPLYVGNILIYLGLGIMSYALFPYLQIIALMFFVFQYYLIVKAEEEYLFSTFGEQYKKYFQSVPRFFPRFTPHRDDSVEQPPFKINEGLKSERRTLQALFAVSILILIKYFLSK